VAEDGAIAVIGIACRFPGPPTRTFWELLKNGVDPAGAIS